MHGIFVFLLGTVSSVKNIDRRFYVCLRSHPVRYCPLWTVGSSLAPFSLTVLSSKRCLTESRGNHPFKYITHLLPSSVESPWIIIVSGEKKKDFNPINSIFLFSILKPPISHLSSSSHPPNLILLLPLVHHSSSSFFPQSYG